MEAQEQLAARHIALRERAGLTQEEEAKRAGVSPTTISGIESGKITRPHLKTLLKLARALGADVGELRESGKAQAPSSQEKLFNNDGLEGGRRPYPFPWLSEVLARLLATWDEQVRSRQNPAQSRTIMVSALDVQDAVTLIAAEDRSVWDALPEQEKAERKALADWLEDLAMRGYAHYKESKDAQKAELEAVERRREEMRRRTREIA